MSTDRTSRLARVAFLAASWLFVACLVVQLFLVGLDLFEATGDEVGIHREFAYVYGWLAPGMVLLAVAARVPPALLRLTLALLVLFAVQTYLPSLAETAPLLASVHAVNALAVLWIAVAIGRAARLGVLQPSREGAS